MERGNRSSHWWSSKSTVHVLWLITKTKALPLSMFGWHRFQLPNQNVGTGTLAPRRDTDLVYTSLNKPTNQSSNDTKMHDAVRTNTLLIADYTNKKLATQLTCCRRRNWRNLLLDTLPSTARALALALRRRSSSTPAISLISKFLQEMVPN